MSDGVTREAAAGLLKKYNKEEFHLLHALTVEGVMRWYANDLGFADEADYWATIGLLHDVDFECFPDEHCKKAPELLRALAASAPAHKRGKNTLRRRRTDGAHLGRGADAPLEKRLRHGAQKPQEKIQR